MGQQDRGLRFSERLEAGQVINRQSLYNGREVPAVRPGRELGMGGDSRAHWVKGQHI